jgi:putative phosphoribosyl transferase
LLECIGELLWQIQVCYYWTGVLVVMALPRRGVPVASEVARALNAPNVCLVRKLGVPGFEKLAMGAIATGGVRILNEEVIRSLGIRDGLLDKVTEKKQQEPLEPA